MPDQLVSAPDQVGTLFDAATTRAAQLTLAAGERVATASTADVAHVSDLIDGLLAPLTRDGSAVWTRNPDPTSCVSRWQTELAPGQIRRILAIVEAFGLEGLYGASPLPLASAQAGRLGSFGSM